MVGQRRTLFSAGRESSWFNLWVGTNIAYSFVSGVVGVWLPLVLVQRYTNAQVGSFSSIGVIALLIGAVGARLLVNLPLPGLFATWATCGDCLSAGLVAIGASEPAATAVRFTGYMCSSLSSPSLSNYVAQQFPAEKRGKVYAMQVGASSVLAPLGMLLASLLLIWFPAWRILGISSALGLVLAAVPLVKREAWRFEVTAPVAVKD